MTVCSPSLAEYHNYGMPSELRVEGIVEIVLRYSTEDPLHALKQWRDIQTYTQNIHFELLV